MELWELLGVSRGVTALIGGGGKTTMMYTLARELSARGAVICTTTARIFPPEHLPVLERVERVEGCICAGTPAEAGKLSAPEQPIAELAALADYVLVEADGSKGLPVKAHEPHEPVIPPEAGRTVVVIGASGFGRPAREAVHRLETFCRLTGAAPDAPVTPEPVARLIRAEGFGGMVFVNQAERPEDFAAARRLAALLDRPVCAGALRRGEWRCL